ncbi:MAG TPA: AsmA family protein [Woeseiaceae bacterium]|nr:AsmA family protein [Woeseiaceae bacterium]
MRWRRIAFWITFSTVALIVLVLGWLWTADLGVFKPQLERFVTERTGRNFAIDGEFRIDLGAQTTVIAEAVRFGNAAWAESEDMVTVGRAEVRFDLWSLVNGPVLIGLVDIDDTGIQLLNPGDKAPNWELPAAGKPGARKEADEPGLGVLFGQVDIDRLQVHIESVERDRPLHLVIEHFRQALREDDYLDLDVRGALDGRRVEIDGAFGPWSALLAGKDFEADFDAQLDTFTLSAHGRVDDIADLRRPEFEFAASGPDIDDLTRMLGLGEEGEGDIALSGTLNPVEDGPLLLELKGNLGLTRIDAYGEVADLQSYGDMKLRATSSGPDLGRILRLVGIHQVREAPYRLRFDAESRGNALTISEASMVFADATFEGSATIPRFPGIDDAVIDLQIQGADIERFRYITGLPGAASGPFSSAFTVDMREDGVQVFELTARTSLGEFRGDGSVGDPDTFLGTEFNVQLNTDSLSRLAAAYGVDDMPDTPAEISGAAQYTADGIRTNGPVSMEIDGMSAQVDGLITLQGGIRGTDVSVKAAGGDLAELVSMFAEATAVPTLPYEVNGRLRVRDDGFRFTDIAGSLGTTSVSGEGLLVPASMLAGTRFDVSARGEQFEELVESLGDVEVRPGSFELGGSIVFRADAIALSNVRLERETGEAKLDLTVGVGRDQRYLDFDLLAKGPDVRSILRGIEGFEAFEQPFSVDVDATLRGSHWTFDELDVLVGDATVTAGGDIELAETKAATTFSLALDIPSLARLGTVDGRRFHDQGFSVTANAQSGDGWLAAEDIIIRIGNSDMAGSLLIRQGEVPEIDIDLRSDRLVYQSLLEDLEAPGEAQPEFADGRLIPDAVIPFDAMKKVNVSVAADIGEFQRDNLYMSSVVLDAALRDGAVDIRDFRFDARAGRVAARASLEPDGDSGRANIQLVGRQVALGLSESSLDLAMTHDVDVNLRSSGTTVRALAGNANGGVYIDSRGGRIARGNQFMQAIYGDTLEEILNTINPFRSTDPYTDIECMIVPLTITDGLVQAAPSVFVSTSRIRLVAQAELNLKNERIRLGARTTPRRFVSFSAAELVNPYIQIVGTLASPRLAVDETGVLITGGAAVATGGLSLLARGLWDRVQKSGDACGQVSTQALNALDGRLPDLALESPPQPE